MQQTPGDMHNSIVKQKLQKKLSDSITFFY